jgi:cytochrome c
MRACPGVSKFLLLLFVLLTSKTLSLSEESYKVLVFSKTAGFRHASIPNGWQMIQQLGSSNNFTVDITEDSTAFTYTNLAQYKAIVWLSTTGDVLDSNQQAAFEQYIRNNGGFVGLHAASDTEYSWPWYGQLVGAYFMNHPAIASATIKVADAVHPSTTALPRRWSRVDEWYNFHSNPRGKVHVLATLDETTYSGGGMGFDHPIAWCHQFDGGRAWYTGLGHTEASYSEPLFRQHVLGGIEWAAGVKTGDGRATLDSSFQRVILDPAPVNAMELSIARDGRVFIAERAGRVRIWKPETASLVTAGQISVFTGNEDGLLSIALDPGFETNNWLYLFHSPAGATPKQHISRFTMIGDTMDLASEKVVLQIPTQRDQCCHSGGSLAFGPDGSLFISTGDNTNPFESNNYNPIDERPGRSIWDAQKSSSNANDLRGKILRIRPQPDGTYTVPPDNLFPPGTDGTRAEIYAMGSRNPFRIAVDQLNGWLYWGDVGPDSTSTNINLGPIGHDEWNQARSAGNYGWPYFLADNRPFRDRDFATNTLGPFFDPAAPVNNSPNNTGITNLPPAQPAWLWTMRTGVTPAFPELLNGGGGRCAMAGPIYRYNAALDSQRKLPAYFDNTLFIYDWSRDYIWEVKLDDNGDLLKINRFLPTFTFIRPHEMEIGLDGAIYMIEWGTGFNGYNPDARITRIDYVGGNRAPIAVASATPNSGGTPLLVQFSSAGTHDPETNALSYAWSFFRDGTTNSTNPNPMFNYPAPGNYTARLTVRDTAGNAAVADVPVVVGNHRPVVEITWPPTGSVFDWNKPFSSSARVFDVQEGATTNGLIACTNLVWNLSTGHADHAHGVAQTNGCTALFFAPANHGESSDNAFLVLRASYTDLGATPAAALTGEAVHLLQPRRKEAEHHSSQGGISNAPTLDVEGNLDVTCVDHGDFISFIPLNLTNVTALTFRVAATAPGTQIELRRDTTEGTLLTTIPIPDTGGNYTNLTVPILDPGGTHELFLIFRRNPGDTDLLRLNWMQFEGNGIAVPVPLTITPNKTNMVITFSGSATLLQADNVNGPWQAVEPPATSPYTVSPEIGSKFYRLRWP